MARRRTAPFVPLLYRRTICVANRKRKEKTKKTLFLKKNHSSK